MEHLFTDGSLSFVGQEIECVPPWLSSKYGANTTRIDLSFNNLRSIKALSGFPLLTELILDNNQLTDEIEIPKLEKLQTLTINKNNLKKLDLFLKQISEKLPNLRYLSMLGNEACPTPLSNSQHDEEDYQRYRYYVLYCLPNLKFLDSTPVTPAERKEAKRKGEFMKPIIFTDVDSNSTTSTSNNKNKSDIYTPLPSSATKEGRHKGSYGKCRYVYYGKHSEGNRFIGNNSL